MNRREFCLGSSALALTTAALACAIAPFGLAEQAFGQTPSPAALLEPGPFEEMTLGKADAPVTIIEYASLTCPHCANFATKTFPELKKRYVDAGKVRYIYREFVLNPLDAAGVMLLRCSDKDKYFALLETLFQKQEEWVVQKPLPPLLAIAKQAGFTEDSFNQCLSNQALLDKIDSTRQRASEKFGVNSTPTFFINGKIHRGDMTIDQMAKEIDPYLKG
jgi:protein-disulfide isomerase